MHEKNQASPFQQRLPFGGRGRLLDLDGRLRALLTDLIAKQSTLSHAQICDRLTAELGFQVSPAILDSWRASSKTKYRIPAVIIIAISHILDAPELVQALLEPLDAKAFFGADVHLANKARYEKWISILRVQAEREAALAAGEPQQ